MFKILIIDDDPTIRMVLKRALQNQGYDITLATSGEEGIIQAQQVNPALIICDWMMPQLSGIEVCRLLKATPQFSTTFFILLTAKGEVADRVMGLDAGADDFLSKPIDINELKARVRAGLRLYQLNQDLQIQKQALEILNQDLQTQKQILEAELAEAVDYVRSLLPQPLVGNITTEALFIPSAQLGGDCFDYYWLNDDNLVIYLLDVSGHGVGSALLSVSVLNVLRSQSLPNTNFLQPHEVLKTLNNAFPMNEQGDKYFTIWYGVYNLSQHRLIYASAGHPPALLMSSTSQTTMHVSKLGSPGLPIGFLPDVEFDNNTVDIKQGSTIYIFSDGAYEIQLENGNIWAFDAFTNLLTSSQQRNCYLEEALNQIKTLTSKDSFDDDLSLIRISFT